MNQNLAEMILAKINEFVEKDSRNALAAHGGMRIYDLPLLGIAAADDPLFDMFTESDIIGPIFMKPQEWLDGAQSVLSLFLPFTKEVRDTNRKAGLPSEEWASARIDGQAFIDALCTFLVKLLEELGAKAVTPGTDPRFKVEERVSNWSERHVAFAAGLGTFGLHRALITQKGTAGRFCSVIATLKLTPTHRSYTQYYEYCPYLMRGKCGACIKKCPPQAISEMGKDNQNCSDYIDREIRPKFSGRYGCAKCNLSVPCESGIPKETD